jgi:hypothetical protein
MLWDVMITAAFVVVSVAALVCFVVRFILSCLKKAQPIRCLILSPLSSLWRNGLRRMRRLPRVARFSPKFPPDRPILLVLFTPALVA